MSGLNYSLFDAEFVPLKKVFMASSEKQNSKLSWDSLTYNTSLGHLV